MTRVSGLTSFRPNNSFSIPSWPYSAAVESGVWPYIVSGVLGLIYFSCSKCEPRHNLFYVDNTRPVRGVLPGHARRGVVGKVVEQIGRGSGSYSI